MSAPKKRPCNRSPFTSDELLILRRMWRKDETDEAISAVLGRPVSSIQSKRCELGLLVGKGRRRNREAKT